MTRFLTTTALVVSLMAGTALAKTPISKDQRITQGLISVAIAHEIRSTCDTISPRLLRAYQFVKGLWSHAEALGHSEAEIEAYVDDDTEKERLKGLARAYMAKNGVVPGEAESYCMLGRAEIASGSSIGRLLRAK